MAVRSKVPPLFTFIIAAMASALLCQAACGDSDARPELMLQTAHSDEVYSVAYSPDGRYLASGSRDTTAKLWDARTGRLLWNIEGMQAQYSVAFSPDGGWLTVADTEFAEGPGRTWCVRLYDVAARRSAQFLPSDGYVTSTAFSADGKLLAIGTATSDKPVGRRPADTQYSIAIWDVETHELRKQLTGHTGTPWWLTFLTDGRLVSGADDGTIRVWDPQTGQTLQTLRWADYPPSKWDSRPYGAVAVTPDLAHVATAWNDGTVTLWDMATGEKKHTMETTDIPLCSLAFSPDGRRLATASGWAAGSGWVFDTDTGKTLHSFAMPDRVDSLTFTPDGAHIAAGLFGGGIEICESSPSGSLLSLRSEASEGSPVFSPDGSIFASRSRDSMISLWDTYTGQLLRRLEAKRHRSAAVSAFAFSDDGKILVVSGYACLGLWDVHTGEFLMRLDVGGDHITGVALSPSHNLLVTADMAGTAKIWDLNARTVLHTFAVLQNRSSRKLRLSPDASLVTAQGEDGLVGIWDVASGELIRKIPGCGRPLAFTADGNRLACSSTDVHEVFVYDVATGNKVFGSYHLWDCVFAAAFSSDSSRLLVVCNHACVFSFDMATGKWLTWHTPPRPMPWAQVDVSPDLKRMVYDSSRGIALWNAENGVRLLDLVSLPGKDDAACDWLAVTPQGYYDGSANAAGLVSWRVGSEVFPLDAFRDLFHRPDLVERALRGEALDDERALTDGDIPPRIKVVTPEALEEVSIGAALITVFAQGVREIKRLEIYANGRRADAEVERGIAVAARGIPVAARGIAVAARDEPEPTGLMKAFSGLVPLPPGERRVLLRFVAVDEIGLRSRPVEVTVFQRDATPVKGTLHVLAVGVSDYKDSRYDLGLAARDALAVADAAKSQAGQERLYSDITVKSLVDSEATSEAVIGALSSLVSTAAMSDTVVLFLSGHGLRDKSCQYYFATHETNLDSLGDTAVGWREFQSLVRELRAKHVLVLLDTCHAAAALGTYAATNQALGEALADRAGVMVLASSSAAEKSYESAEWEHGAFTKALLEALNGEAGERITPGILEDYVGARVAEITEGRQHPYVPIRTQFPAGVPLLLSGLH